jgi:hypothetical protein
MKVWLVCFLILFSVGASSQVLNVESRRFHNDTNGWVGRLGFSFMLVQNKVQLISLGNNAQLQYRKNRSRFLFLSSTEYTRAGNADFVNTGYQHLRYNYKINEWLTWEALVQVQYNKVLKVDLRAIAGTGPRIKLVKQENFRSYLGLIHLIEREEITGDSAIYYTQRLSSYLTFTWNISKTVEFISTTFYQPNYADFSDYRIATTNALEIDILRHLSFRTGFDLLYDTRQPAGIPNLTYTLKNGVDWKF